MEKNHPKKIGFLIWVVYNLEVLRHFGLKNSIKKNLQNLHRSWTVSGLYA